MKNLTIKGLIIFAALSQAAFAQNTERRSMNQDSTSIVPFGAMISATTNTTSSTSTYTSPPPPINGSCGASNNSILTSSPTSFLCDKGTASAVTNSGGTYSWTCSGNNYSSAANVTSCSAQQRVVAQCGSDNGKILSSTPTNLCTSGTASVVSSYGLTYNWSCSGNYGAPVSCSATGVSNVCSVSTSWACGGDTSRSR